MCRAGERGVEIRETEVLGEFVLHCSLSSSSGALAEGVGGCRGLQAPDPWSRGPQH